MMKSKNYTVLLASILILLVALTGCSSKEPEVSEATETATTIETTEAVTTTESTEAVTTAENAEALTARGTVDGVEWGDYLHLNITTDSGEALSFFVLTEVKENPETLKPGQRVTVTYVNRKQIMNPPGQEIEFLELLSVTIEN